MDYIEEGLFKKKQKVILSTQDRKNIVKKVTTFLKQNVKKYDKRLNISYDGYEADPKSSHEYMTDEFIQGNENGYTVLYTDFDYNKNKNLSDNLNKIIEDITSYMNDNRIRFEDGGHNGQYYINLFMNDYISESYTPERGEIKMKSINSLANIARSYGIEPTANRLRDDIVEEYTDIINSLSFVDESVIVKDIALLPVYTMEEGYAIDLDTLKYVVESKEMTIQEAIQEIRDVNYIGDTIPMYCVLPGNINENMTLESFINLTESLNKYEVTPIAIREFSDVEFITEASISQVFDKVKSKIENIPENKRQKTIDKCKANNKALKEELDKINAMSPEEQEKYAKKNAAKNLGTFAVETAGSFGAGAMAGLVWVYIGPVVGITSLGIAIAGMTKLSVNRDSKGKHNFEVTAANYKQGIKNTITFNNMTINKMKAKK